MSKLLLHETGEKPRNTTPTPVGAVFGRLTVKGLLPYTKHRNRMYFCECECGNTTEVYSHSLRAGTTTSCGCFAMEARRAKAKHGRNQTDPTYASWIAARKRVAHNPKYASLGMDPRWDDFLEFLRDMGERPAGCTLDRKDNTLGYWPSNCRWATPKQQANNRSITTFITIDGITQPLSVWADSSGISAGALHSRLRRGWDPRDAISVPLTRES